VWEGEEGERGDDKDFADGASNAARYSHDPRQSYFKLWKRTEISVRVSKEFCAALGLARNARDETRRKRMPRRLVRGDMGLENRIRMLWTTTSNGKGTEEYLKGFREVPCTCGRARTSNALFGALCSFAFALSVSTTAINRRVYNNQTMHMGNRGNNSARETREERKGTGRTNTESPKADPTTESPAPAPAPDTHPPLPRWRHPAAALRTR
jgi:hypothetical protein